LCCNFSHRNIFSNAITGALPSELGALNALTKLYDDAVISCCCLIAFFALHSDANDNDLSQDLPSELGNLHSLSYLDLSSNSFTGLFPTDMLRLTSLKYLYVSFWTLACVSHILAKACR
jgi:hypothetical protein